MSITSESDERMTPNNGEDSPSLDDANVEGNVGGNGPLKKGPWTSAEDAILVEYVNKHGEGNWNAVQKHSGLARCGKSCRLRWANHLRPDLKKGAFTPEEERRIIELHFKMGNKWARMAAELPGRTDNEIKNFWNTRIKRRQRQGLPMYPPDLCLQSLNDSQHGDSMNNFSSGDVHHHQDLMPVNDLDIPAVEFKNQVNAPALLDFPAGNLLDLLKVSTVHPSKRLRGSESSIHGLNTPICNVYTGGSQYQSDCPMSFVQSCLFENATSSSLPSVSEPTWAMKLELPSLQNQMGTLGSPSPSSPFLESVDALMQTPPNEHMQTCNLSSQNSGLLDAVLYESTKKPKSYCTSRMDHLAHGYNEAEWEPYNDQLSPCTSSVFNESTPIGRTSLDEQYSAGAVPDASNGGQVPSDDRVETNNPMMISRPDFLLGSNYFHPIGTLFGDDMSRDCKKVDAEATLSTQGHAHDSGAWSVMPTV